eukprot:06682.XXX_295350_295499_1 [CDS] Oithona nana genome sequencing.
MSTIVMINKGSILATNTVKYPKIFQKILSATSLCSIVQQFSISGHSTIL